MICVTDHSTRHGRFKPPSFESLWDSSGRIYTTPGAPGSRERLNDTVLTMALFAAAFTLMTTALIHGVPKWFE